MNDKQGTSHNLSQFTFRVKERDGASRLVVGTVTLLLAFRVTERVVGKSISSNRGGVWRRQAERRDRPPVHVEMAETGPPDHELSKMSIYSKRAIMLVFEVW